MRCLSKLGANLVIQDEANPGPWTGPDGNGIEKWQPLSWMTSTYRTVSDPSVDFDYNVTAMMVGNLADLVFDGQSAITERGLRGPGGGVITSGTARSCPVEDETLAPALRRAARAISSPWRRGLSATARGRPCVAWATSSLRVGRVGRTTISRPLSSPICPSR